MRTNHQIKTRHALLDEKGRLIEPGYTKGLMMDYDKTKHKGGKFRLKEWDYYLIACDDFAVALTVADNAYMGLDSYSLLDFRTGFQHTAGPMSIMPMGKLNMPETSETGNVYSGDKNHFMEFIHNGDHRILKFEMKNFLDGKTFSGEIRLDCPEMESMVVVTPWKEKDTAFYYNQKINCMPATGTVKFGDEEYTFPEGKSFGTLDWGRGVWTYENTWYWGSASGQIDGVPFGFNIGYGFGDTTAASENMLFYNNKAHKLSEVTFNIPMVSKTFKTRGGCCGPSGDEVCTADLTEDYMSPWTFTSDDGRFEMDFEPIMDRASCTDFKVLVSDQHQVFGKFTGKAILDDGTVIEIKDFLGFAEKVHNKW